ncbi:MAG: hypothetical protein KF749_02885 [Bacteroidetes bacterium]|nr:hypothetical protein [Bacteroidota bacterium]MCW5896762.1 hypothetical protein [Bacteroidota bacterium]
MAKNKRLARFESLSLIDKIKSVKEYLTSPWSAVQLRGMQKMEDCLAQMTNPDEREYFLGLVTGSFVHEEQIRKWAAQIMRERFPERWEYVGVDLETFYANPLPQNLKKIIRKGLDLLEQGEPPRKGISSREAPSYFQPNHRHGLDLLWLGTESGIFSLPADVGDTSRSRFVDFIEKDFQSEFPNAKLGEQLHSLLKMDLDPFVLRRILDFFGRTGLPKDETTSAFDVALELIQPPPYKDFEYSNDPHAYYQVIESGIRSARLLWATPLYESARSIIGNMLHDERMSDGLVEQSKRCHDGYWSSEQWEALLEKWKIRSVADGENLEKAFAKTRENRIRLIHALESVIRQQNDYRNKPDQCKDANRQNAIKALGEIGACDSLFELRKFFDAGLQCESVSYTLQMWHFALVRNFDQFKSEQCQEIVQHLLTLGRSRKAVENHVMQVMGKCRSLNPKKWNDLVRYNSRYVANNLVTLYIGKGEVWNRNPILRKSIACYKSSVSGFKMEDFLHLWNMLLTPEDELLDERQVLMPELIEELRCILRDALRQAPDRATMIKRFVQFSFLIEKLDLSENLSRFIPTDDELIVLRNEDSQLRHIKDAMVLKKAFDEETVRARKLTLWLELATNHPKMPYQNCPFALEDRHPPLDLISDIKEYRWIESVPVLMKLPVREIQNLLDLLRCMLQDERTNSHYGFLYGGLNKYVRQHLSGEAAYYLYEELRGETELTDAELSKFAWLSLLRASQFANEHHLPFPPEGQSDRTGESEAVSSRLASALAQLDFEETLVGTAEGGTVKLLTQESLHHHRNVVFASPVMGLRNVWRVVTNRADFPSAIADKIKNLHLNTEPQSNKQICVGDCVLGSIERLCETNSGEKFIVDLGASYPKGIWSEPEIGETQTEKLGNLGQLHLFMVAGREQAGDLILSKRALIASLKEVLLNVRDNLEMEVALDAINLEGNVRVLCGHLPFEVSREEVSWANLQNTLEVIKLLEERQERIKICLVRPAEGAKVIFSFKRRKPVWGAEKLAMFFGTAPFKLTFVNLDKNDLLFEVHTSLPESDYPDHFVRPGTLCKLSAERMVDKDEFNYHPLLTAYPPKCGETFEAQWLLPQVNQRDNRPWQQQGECVLKLRRIAPYRYDLHGKFELEARVTIIAQPSKPWSDKPQTVEIIEPQFEERPVPAILEWDKVDSEMLLHLGEIDEVLKLRAKIIGYRESVPLVIPLIDEFRKFEVGDWYHLKVIGSSRDDWRNWLNLSHWTTRESFVINEDQLAYNPKITIQDFPCDTVVEARYVGKNEKRGEMEFSLLLDSPEETIQSVERLKLPANGIYIGYQEKGYDRYVWIERKPGICLRIARQCFEDFGRTHFYAGDAVSLKPGRELNRVLLVHNLQVQSGGIRSILAQEEPLKGLVISEDGLVRVTPPGIRSMNGRLVGGGSHYRTRARIDVRAERIWMSCSSGIPKLHGDLVPVADSTTVPGIDSILKEKTKNEFFNVWGRVQSAGKDGLRIKSWNYDSDITFLVPYRDISHVVSRRDYQYYQSRANRNLVRGFRVMGVDTEKKLVKLSLCQGIPQNLNRNGKLNAEFGIDKGEACLIRISEDNRSYIFETATLVICRVSVDDILITPGQRRSYFNWKFIDGMFSFAFSDNNKLVLRALPVRSLSETLNSLRNHVFRCHLSNEREKWRIRFLGEAAKRHIQLQHVQAFLALEDAQILTEKVSDQDIFSVVFGHFDKEQEAFVFRIWDSDKHQKYEIEIQLLVPEGNNTGWRVRPANGPVGNLKFPDLTSNSSLSLFGLTRPMHPVMHPGTLNFNVGEWHSAILVKHDNSSKLSLTGSTPREVGELDQFFLENPNEKRLVFTMLQDTAKSDEPILVERVPGMNYRIPLSRFDRPQRIKDLRRGDRIIAHVVRFDNISFRLEIEMFLRDGWLWKIFLQSAQPPHPNREGYIKDASFVFEKWGISRNYFSVFYTNHKKIEERLLLQLSALPAEQRSSFLWLKPGDRLHGRLMVAHEGLRYSEHGVFQITRVEVGLQHEVKEDAVRGTGRLARVRIEEILENGYRVVFEEDAALTGFLPNQEAKCLSRNNINLDNLKNLEIPVLITAADRTIEVSYDQYLSERVQTFGVASLLPGIVKRACAEGAFIQFPGFVTFILYDELIYGYFGKGKLQKNMAISCVLREWSPSEGRILLSRVPTFDDAGRNETFVAKIVSKHPDCLLVRYEQSYGMVAMNYVKSEFHEPLETGDEVRLSQFMIGKKRHLSVRSQSSMIHRKQVAWDTCCKFFPAWAELVWTNLWDRRKQSKHSEYDWLAFGSQLSELFVPINSTTATAVARFLAAPLRQLHLFAVIPEASRDDWSSFLSGTARIIMNPQLYREDQDPLVLLAAIEYFLSVEEYADIHRSHQEHSIDWKVIYAMVNYTHERIPESLNAGLGRIIAARRSGADMDYTQLVEEVVQRLGSHFELFLQPYWPDWKQDMENHAVATMGRATNPLEQYIPGELGSTVDTIENWIREVKTKPTLKVGRLHYLLACLYFVSQNEEKVQEHLEEAGYHLGSVEEDRAWRRRIEVLRLCMSFLAGRLHERPTGRPSEEAWFDNLVDLLKKYCNSYHPESESDSNSIIFSTGLAVALRDYGSLSYLLEARRSSPSFLTLLLQNFLDNRTGRMEPPDTLNSRDLFLKSGISVHQYLIR